MKPSIVSIHEVAHALVAHTLGSTIIDIEKRDAITGFTTINHGRDIIIIACTAIAGHEAEILWCGTNINEVPEDDWNQLEELNITVRGANILRESVIKFLKNNKKLIFKLAKILDDEMVMKRDRFLELIK